MLEDLNSIDWGSLHTGHGTAEYLPENLRKLMSDDPADWTGAIEALRLTLLYQGTYWPALPRVIGFLIRLAGSTEINCRAEVLELLTDLAMELSWERAAFLQEWRMLVDFLADPDPGIRVSAGYLLGKIGRTPLEDWPDAIRQAGAAAQITAALRRALSSEPVELIQVGHVFSIAAMADHDRDAVDALRDQLAAPSSPGVELAAAMSLVERGSDVPIGAIDILVRLVVDNVDYYTIFEFGQQRLGRFPWLEWPERETGPQFELIKMLCTLSPRYLDRILPAFLFALGEGSPHSVLEVLAPILGYLFAGRKLSSTATCVDLTPPQRAALEILFEREALFNSSIGIFRGLMRSMGLPETRWKWERLLDKPGWRADSEQQILANLGRFVQHSDLVRNADRIPLPGRVPDEDLRYLNLDGIVDGDAYMAYLSQFPNLRVLSLRDSEITDRGLQAMPAFPRLKEIYLYGNPITDEGLAALGRMPALEMVGVDGIGIGDRGVLTIVESLSGLIKVSLIAPGVTDQGVRRLAEFLPMLRELTLCQTAVTDAALPWLYRLSRLEKLDVRSTSLSPAALRALRERLPGCQIMASR